jgi:hypothetical protein
MLAQLGACDVHIVTAGFAISGSSRVPARTKMRWGRASASLNSCVPQAVQNRRCKRSTKADLVNDAKSGKTHYVHQDDSDRAIEFGGWRAAECKLLRVWNVTNSSGVCPDRGAPWKHAFFPGQKSRFGFQFFHCGGQGRFVVTFGVPDQIRCTGFRLMEERRSQCRPATTLHVPRLLIT